MSTGTGSPDRHQEQVARAFEALPELVANNADLLRRGRFMTCDFKIGVGELPLVVSVAQGRVTSVARGPFLLRPWAFSLTAAPETWLQLLEPIPAAGVHDVMALSKRGLLKIEGNLQPFMANLQFVKDVIAAPRALERRA